LAEALGVTRQTINAIENQRVMPSLCIAFKLAQYFERPIEDVFAYNQVAETG
jgi:putative transcriptional regulator